MFKRLLVSAVPFIQALVIASTSSGLANAELVGDYRTVIVSDAPAHYYRLGEASNSLPAKDEMSATGGTYVNSPTVGQAGALLGDSNSAVSFDGVNDYVSIANQTTADFSLELWIKTTAQSRTGSQAYYGDGLIWSDVAGTADDFVLAILNNRASFFDGDANGGAGRSISGTTLLNDGQWHHLVATRQSGNATNGLQLYVDGRLEVAGGAGTAILDDNSKIAIGGNTLDGRYYTGSIDEVAIYNNVLSPGQVANHFNAAVPEPSSLLLALLALVTVGRRAINRAK